MSKTFRFGLVALPLIFCLFSDSMMAQEKAPAPDQTPAAAQPPPTGQPQQQPGQPMPQGAGIPPTMTVAPATLPPPKDPYVLEDGGFYLEPFYWLNGGQPRLRGGLTATNIGDLQFNNKRDPAMGVEVGVPAGRGNTVRVTVFRTEGFGNVTLKKDAIIFGEPYTAGEFLNATYKTQVIKASWDYLSYTWRKPTATIHLKTLFEAQYITTRFATAAPFVAGSLDTTNNNNLASGSKSLVLPTLGMALGSQFGKYFRWDVRASGFGIPQRGAIGDVQATVAVRVSKVEVLVGEKLLYFKTSPRTDMYTNNTMQGVYGGLRFVWNGVTPK